MALWLKAFTRYDCITDSAQGRVNTTPCPHHRGQHRHSVPVSWGFRPQSCILVDWFSGRSMVSTTSRMDGSSLSTGHKVAASLVHTLHYTIRM